MRFSIVAPLVLACLPASALAQTAAGVSLVSKTQAVIEITDAKGVKKKTLVDPKTVIPGQPIVIWLNYKNNGKTAANNFVINNPVPNGLDFTAFGEKSDWAIVSVDGGKAYGPLTSLKVKGADNKPRPALAGDVTHLRWAFARPIAPGASGTISFYAVVE